LKRKKIGNIKNIKRKHHILNGKEYNNLKRENIVSIENLKIILKIKFQLENFYPF
jgi:hypothetical protein